MRKKVMALMLSFAIAASVLPLTFLNVSASAEAEELPNGAVAVDLQLTGEQGSRQTVQVGEITYSVVVGTTGFSRLSEALEAVPDGGTVYLSKGIYSESVTVKKDVAILGPKAGINPNVKGKNPTDDWMLNPLRGKDEAVITTSWHMGIYAPGKQVFDCHNITVDGVAMTGAAMFRSNFGEQGNITLNYRNIYVYDYTTKNNGPFYCYSFYPNRSANLYSRELNAENIRFEGMHEAPGFNLTVDRMDLSGIYFDSESTAGVFTCLTASETVQKGGTLNYTVRDSMFRQKTTQILNCNLSKDSGGHHFMQNIGQANKVTVQINNNVFFNNDTAAASNNNLIVPQISSGNIFFTIKDNLFYQSEKASDSLIAIHGATGELALGENFTVTNNRFVNIPTALAIKNSTTAFDLSGNYFAIGGQPAKPAVIGPDCTEWWYLDMELTKTSTELADQLDGVFTGGTVNKAKKTLTDRTEADTYTFRIRTESYNTLTVYADAELTQELGETVTLYEPVSRFYLKIASANGKKYEIYTASITTTNPDLLSYRMDSEVRFFGRTYEDNGNMFFSWSASGFEFRFRGSGVKAKIGTVLKGQIHTAYLKIYVDGVEQPDVALTSELQTVVLAKNLNPEAEHTVKVLKRTNPRSSPAYLVSLRLTDGVKLAPAAASDKLIEFIGDSITVGYATVEGNYNAWSTSTEDVTKTYAPMVAEAFGADYMVTAVSGRGIVRNTGGDSAQLFPELYEKLDYYNNPGVDYDFALQPDVIVINLGTNDASSNNPDLTGKEFRVGLRAFLETVRKHNPNAEIIYAYGMMTQRFLDDIATVVDDMIFEGDEHISFVRLDQCPSSMKRLGHPVAKAYEQPAQQLIERIEKTVGWRIGGEETPSQPENTAEPIPETTQKPIETEAPGTATEPISAEPVKKGCGSSVRSMLAVFLCTVAAVAVFKRNRHRKDC